MKEDDSRLLLALRTEQRAKVGGRADPHPPPPLLRNQFSVKAPPGNAAHFFIPVAMR